MVQPRDEDALVAALDRLLSDPDLRARYAERNVEIVRSRVSESAPAMEELYRSLVDAYERSPGRAS
jgi:glycosyltransferase involved in cell wall biosynthesis